MKKQIIIERTLKAINQLPEDKATEISDFADFVSKRHEEQKFTEGMHEIMSESKAFKFLDGEEELYTTDDLQEIYNNG